MHFYIEDLDGNLIGETNIVDFDNGLKLSPNLTTFMDNKSEPFGMNNPVSGIVFLLKNRTRGQGWGEKLKCQCHYKKFGLQICNKHCKM
jgi:hypothetical protein